MYGEDLDLSLRLRLAGWGVGVVPAARVEHDYEFAKGDYKWFHLERNRWWTVLARLSRRRCWRCVAPALLAFELALLAVAARGGWLRAEAARAGGRRCARCRGRCARRRRVQAHARDRRRARSRPG